MLVTFRWAFTATVLLCVFLTGNAGVVSQETAQRPSDEIIDWNQWRGPNRTGVVPSLNWPDKLDEATLKQSWKVDLGPSYSGPIVVDDKVFTTETVDRKFEVVTALDRKTGKQLWSTRWEGALSVPFFAKANGDWIRSTPAYDNGRLYVGGMRDVLVCLNAENGEIVWKVDFPSDTQSTVPAFGFVCSPLVDQDAVYVQAGGGFCKLNKTNGEIIWKTLQDGGGMNGSAFSSPIITTIGDKRQAVVQTRTDLAGVDLESGSPLWSQPIKTFRGMNILTPTPYQNGFFVSAYGGVTQYLKVVPGGSGFNVTQAWQLPVEGYMTTPVIVDGHAYTHLRNGRFACFSLEQGTETWRSKPFGKYASLIASGDKILALDQKGKLILLKANPQKMEVLDDRTVGDDSWAHLAVRGNQVFVRNLDSLIAFQWQRDSEAGEK